MRYVSKQDGMVPAQEEALTLGVAQTAHPLLTKEKAENKG